MYAQYLKPGIVTTFLPMPLSGFTPSQSHPYQLGLPLDSEHQRQGRAGQRGAGRHSHLGPQCRWQRPAVRRLSRRNGLRAGRESGTRIVGIGLPGLHPTIRVPALPSRKAHNGRPGRRRRRCSHWASRNGVATGPQRSIHDPRLPLSSPTCWPPVNHRRPTRLE